MRWLLALLRKETEALLPYWFAFGVLCTINLAAVLWEAHFVVEPLGDRFSSGSDNAGIVWLLSFLVGHGVVAHELRDGHVEFLDALPVGRGAIYGAKVAAALSLVLSLVAASFAMDLLLVSISRPHSALSPLVPVAVMHTVMLAAGIAGLGMGLLLSWLGPLAWGVLGLVLFISLCLGVIHPPLLGWLPLIGSFGDLEWVGTTARHPANSALCWLFAGVLGMMGSGLLFLGPGRLLTDRGSDAIAVVRSSAVGCLFLLAVPLGCLSSVTMLADHAPALVRGKSAMPSDEGGFRILYAPGYEDRASEVAARIDGISRQVAVLLGDTAVHPAPWFDVELLGAPENHLGVFTGGKIRLSYAADDATLTHELAHAHAYAVSGKRAWYQQNSTHFFEEGLADWAEALVTGRDPVLDLAGAIDATGQARFEDLVDHQRHLARHDLRQSYVLGAAFAAALAEQGGPDAIPCALRQLGQLDRTPIAGLALWYGIASRCGIDLDAVRDHWHAELKAARARIEGPLPELRARVLLDGTPRIEVRDELQLGFTLVCGFRDDPETPPERWTYQEAVGSVCYVPNAGLSGHSVQYQVGYLLPGTDPGDLSGVYLEWTDVGR